MANNIKKIALAALAVTLVATLAARVGFQQKNGAILLAKTSVSSREPVVPEGIADNTNIKPSSRNATPGEDDIILPSPDLMLGQSFIVGIYGTSLDKETKEYLQQIKPAGVILYSRNYQTQNQLKDLIAELQEVGRKTTGHDYFIMIDEEPGGASRLGLFDNVFAFGIPEWVTIENDIKTMASVGINVDLAPLADFPFNEDTFIKKRIPAHTPAALIDFNAKFIVLSQNNNVSATLKHFPGMGVFIDDPHQKLPYVQSSRQAVAESLKIFKNGIDAGADFVMTGHGVYDDIDYDVPATSSKKITTDMLQNDLGFKGLVITDDLSDMPFIVGKDINLIEATAGSLKSGHDLVMFAHNQGKATRVYEELLDRLQTDPELESAVESNYRQVIYFKNNHSL
jgi:beta-N-acetylhexosaminidase